MAENPYVNKVELANGDTLMDITDTTAQAGDVLAGRVFYAASGQRSTGALGDFTGATASAAGTHGLVPAPGAGDQDCVLRGDGTWEDLSWNATMRCIPFSILTTDWESGTGGYVYTLETSHVTEVSMDITVLDRSIMNLTGELSTAKAPGYGGIVFTTASLPSGTISGKLYTIDNMDGKTNIIVDDAFVFKPFTIDLDDVQNANGSITVVTQNVHVTENMKPVSIEFGTPGTFKAPVTITTGDGTVTLTCADAEGSSTVKVTLIPTQSIEWAQYAPTSITSAEADILAERIEEISGNTKADKVTGATAGNLAGLDSNGNLTDSGHQIVYSATQPVNPVVGMIWLKPEA